MNTPNTYANQANQYKKNQLETATPEEILILLYDAAINFLNKSKVSLEQKNMEQFSKDILNCRNILLEFMNTLDMENGGNVAETLYGLYRYYHMVLVKSEISQNVDGIDEVLRHLINLRGTWSKAIEIAKAEKEQTLVDKFESSESKNTSFEYYDDDEDDETEDDEDADYDDDDDEEDEDEK